MRKASTHPEKLGSQMPPPGEIFQTRPCPVVPSPVQRSPLRSKANPLVPGTPVAKAIASGTAAHSGDEESSDAQPAASGLTFQTLPPEAESATYKFPPASKVMPDGLQPAGFGMNATVRREPSAPIRQIGQFRFVSGCRPVV